MAHGEAAAGPSTDDHAAGTDMLARIIACPAATASWWRSATLAGFVLGGIWASSHAPLDAIPDLSDVQGDRLHRVDGAGADLVEDRSPIRSSTAMLTSAPKVVRGHSMFGMSFVYVIFEEGTDIYWARSRVLEYLNCAAAPPAASTLLGPDATGVGWVFSTPCERATLLAELRTLQDWNVATRSPVRASPRWPAWAASSSSTRSTSTRRSCRPTASRCGRERRRSETATATSAGGCSRSADEYMIRGRGYIRVWTISRSGRQPWPRDACPLKTWRVSSWDRTSAGARGARRERRGRRQAS